MMLCLLRNTEYTIGSKKLKLTINQDPVEVHQRNHQGEAPRNLQVLQKTKSSRSSLGKTSMRERALEEKLKIIHRRKACCHLSLAKLKARSQIFDEIEDDRYLADRYVERNKPTLLEGRTKTSIISKIKKDELMDRTTNLPEIRNLNISSNKEGCQKEADVKGNTKAAKYSVGELPKSKNQKEDNKCCSAHMQNHMCLRR